MTSIETPPADSFADSKCGLCTAICCHHIALEIDAPEEPEDFENMRWYIIHEDTNIFVDDGVWYLQVFRKCTWLDGYKCGRYDDRPTICREYSNDSCDFDGVESDHTFRNIEELEAYRDKWVAEYEQQQVDDKAARRKRLAAKLKRLRKKRRKRQEA